MNILFLTISNINSLSGSGIYADLMNEFIVRGHRVYIASPSERRYGEGTHLIKENNYEILKIGTLNIQKTNVVEKGIGTLLLESQFNRAIRKYWKDVDFGLIIFSTPPITFNKVIKSQKLRTAAPTYLMLKDIFPQNAVDLGMFSKGSIFYKLFRRKERQLYALSDRIGCMSPANMQYVIDHNQEVNPAKVELCPNSIRIKQVPLLSEERKMELKLKYGIPADKTIFVYGGNLGKPQGIDFLLRVVEANEARTDSFIIIVGNGTEFPKIQRWFDDKKPKNARLLTRLPKEDYDEMVRSCDVGLIFLDRRFTIPNFPSRLLGYLEPGMPVLLATDRNTDMGMIAEANGFGYWCESGDLEGFLSNMDKFTPESISMMGAAGRRFLEQNFDVKDTAETILNSITMEK